MALGQVLPCDAIDDPHLHARHGRAEQRQPPGAQVELVGVADVDRLGDADPLEQLAVDGVAHHARATNGERGPYRGLGHAERREDPARWETERLGGGDEGLDRRGIDGLGAVQRQRERREVEAR